jgi:hypothetical protein
MGQFVGVDTREVRILSPSRRTREFERKHQEDQLFAHPDPKIFVPYALTIGRLPREVVIERTLKLYSGFVLEKLLDELGVEWRNPKKAPGSWLPLEAFDNSDFEPRLAHEWLEVMRANGNKPLRGRVSHLCS